MVHVIYQWGIIVFGIAMVWEEVHVLLRVGNGLQTNVQQPHAIAHGVKINAMQDILLQVHVIQLQTKIHAIMHIQLLAGLPKGQLNYVFGIT